MIRHAVSNAAAGLVALTLGVAASSGTAFAQASVLKECGSQYQAAKAANALNGQGWQDYLKECRVRLKGGEAAAPAEAPKPAAEAPKPAETKPVEAVKPVEPVAPAPAPAAEAPAANPLNPAPAAAPAPAPAAPAATTAAPMSPKAARAAAHSRQKKCGLEWRTNKAELKKQDPKITWPKYWSACNKRLKEAGE